MPMLQTALEPAIVALGPYRHGGLLWHWDHSGIRVYYGIRPKTALGHEDIAA
jgi:hypothetical protein